MIINVMTNLREEKLHLLSRILGLHSPGQVDELNHLLFQNPSLDGASISGDQNFRVFGAPVIFVLQKELLV